MRLEWARVLRRFWHEGRGGVAVTFGIGLPALALTIGAAVEYLSLSRRHTELQVAVDTAALRAADLLRLSNNTDVVVSSVATSVVNGVTPPYPDSARQVSATVLQKRSVVQVDAAEDVRSVLGRLMTMPTSRINVTAQARVMGSAKLCLLTLEPKTQRGLDLEKNSLITAPGCGIYSNSVDPKGVRTNSGARATAAVICSAGGIEDKGAILSPSPTTDCPAVRDPLASRQRPSTGLCLPGAPTQKITTSTHLYPGTFCGGLTISGSAQVTMSPGIYVFNDGPLIVTNTAGLSGQNVGFYFTGSKGGLRFDPDTSISLTAPKDGEMAGLLMFEDRSLTAAISLPIGPTGILPTPPPIGSQPMREYRITSDNAPNLLGTIYLPAGRLIIDANRPIADRSAYTVIVARQVDLNEGPNLYLNTDYGATDIPVPDGVGPKSGNITLVR